MSNNLFTGLSLSTVTSTYYYLSARHCSASWIVLLCIIIWSSYVEEKTFSRLWIVYAGDYTTYSLSCSTWSTWLFSRWLARTCSLVIVCVSILVFRFCVKNLTLGRYCLKSGNIGSGYVFRSRVCFRTETLLWFIYRFQRSTTAISVGSIFSSGYFSVLFFLLGVWWSCWWLLFSLYHSCSDTLCSSGSRPDVAVHWLRRNVGDFLKPRW